VKARCVGLEDGSVDFTLGKVYEVDEYDKLDSFPYHIMGDNGKKYWCHKDNFELIPDVPDAPKSEWMQTSDVEFVNMKLDMYIYFEIVSDVHFCRLSHMNSKKDFEIHGEFADAFAALVGYDWSESAR
jgi:hypothetical protein